jgi:hypothetical protein
MVEQRRLPGMMEGPMAVATIDEYLADVPDADRGKLRALDPRWVRSWPIRGHVLWLGRRGDLNDVAVGEEASITASLDARLDRLRKLRLLRRHVVPASWAGVRR